MDSVGSVSTDYQVQQIQAQIDDWRTCPTTDPQTKQVKIGKLQVQMDAVKVQLEAHEKAAKQLQAQTVQQLATGNGTRLDVVA